MAVNQMIQDQTDGLATLRALLNTKQEDIIALHEESRKQAALTEAEQKKADDARTLIAKHQDLLKNIAAENAKHEANVAEIQKGHADLQTAQDAHAEHVKSKERDFAEAIKVLDDRKKNMDGEAKYLADRFKKAQEDLQTENAALAKEKSRIALLERDAQTIMQIALAIKAKYEKKIAAIMREDDGS